MSDWSSDVCSSDLLLSFAEGMAFIAEKNKEKEVCKMIESKS